MTPERPERKSAVYELPRGAQLGKYEILRRIAVGGMAEIYLARVRGTAGFEKMVVLKRILPNVAEDPAFVQMFLDEARLAATLQHPNIADVYDAGDSDGSYFFTMEFVHGQDVRSIRQAVRAKGETVPLAIALTIVHGTASALDYAHERKAPTGEPLGLVHRDVSSSNVLVSYDGAVKLVDFGIARATVRQHKTQTGTLKGKVPYMSPEQCKGLPLDRRSDLFSLGVVLYELTCGRRPFRGDTDFAIMDQIVYQGATPPSQLVKNYPEELEAIVMKLLARAPEQRYRTADAFVHQLEEFVAKHHLWVTAKQLGKYMRTLFADRISALEEAEREGVPFIQHVANTITSQSQASDILTPRSAYPGLPPRPSQQIEINAEPISASQPAVRAESAGIPTGVTVQPAIPSLRPRSHKRLAFMLVGLVAIVAGGIGGYVISHPGSAADGSAAEEAPDVPIVKKMDVVMPDTAVAKPDKPVAKPDKPVAKPDTQIAKPDTQIVKPKPDKPVVKPDKPVVKPDKPVVKPDTRVTRTKPDVRNSDKPDKSKSKPDTQKEQPWDPNSPFLPQ